MHTPYLARMYLRIFQLLLLSTFISNLHATPDYTPDDVFSMVRYANDIADILLIEKGLSKLDLPHSRETAARPMHVYELHVSALAELYKYSLSQQQRPPPMVASTPVKYTPTDVYYLSQMIANKLESIYKTSQNAINVYPDKFNNKNPSHVYEEVLRLFYRLNLLNGKKKVSPSEVYAHIFRAKEDLQYSLLNLSKRIDKSQEDTKRLLVTAIYGTHPDGSTLPAKPDGMKPSNVLDKALIIRQKLNQLRQRYQLPNIKIPSRNGFTKIKPIDVLLQTQFIIAELNLLKIPMNIHSTTNSARNVSNKTPSDVFHVMQHIEYMIDRLLHVKIK